MGLLAFRRGSANTLGARNQRTAGIATVQMFSRVFLHARNICLSTGSCYNQEFSPLARNCDREPAVKNGTAGRVRSRYVA